MKPEQMIKTVKDIVAHREHMYKTGLAFRTLAHLVSIGKIKKNMTSANPKKPEGVKKIISGLESDLRQIMPGKESVYYESTTEKFRNLIKECNNKQL